MQKKDTYIFSIRKLMLISIVLSFVGSMFHNQLPMKSINAATTYLKKQTLTTLPPVKHIQISRGHSHDRQYPGVWLKAGQVIKARQTNPLFKSQITFELLADDGTKELKTSIPTNGAFVTLTAKADSVPFVRTPLVEPGSPKPVIEYEIATDSEEIPVYVEGQDEQAFRDKWAASNAPYAIFDSARMQLLIPIIDRQRVDTTFDGSLLKLAQFYTYIFNQYDRFAGLEENPADPIDLNVPAKYFMKANVKGAGWAYYSVNYVAQNANKMSDLVFPGHGLYHEIGHGYDFNGDDIDLTEMWNNIYAHYLETNSPYMVPAWLYAGVTIDTNENEPYGSFRSRLQFFIDLFDFVGPEKAMSDFNKAYRRAMANGGLKMPMTEFLIRTLSTSSGYNIASYFEHKGFNVPQELKRWSFENGFKNITSIQPLYGISTQAGTISKAEVARQTLGLEHRYTLAPTEKTATLNTRSTITVQLNAPDMTVLQGKEVIVYDGNTEIARKKISGDKVLFDNIPIGEYTVRIPTMPSGLYQYNEFNYVKVKESGVKLDVSYTLLSESLYRKGVDIDFKGLGNALFATIKYEKNAQQLDINKLKVGPHAYFTTPYASYKVYDVANNIVDSADFIGTDKTGFQRNVPFLEGYRLEIYHAEPTRLSINESFDGQTLHTQVAKTATYKLRDGILVREDDTRTNVDVLQDMVRNYLNDLIKKYGVTEAKTRIYHSVHANIIASNLVEMPIPDQQEILNEYKNLFQPIGIQIPSTLTTSLGVNQSQFKAATEQQVITTGNGDMTLVADWSKIPVHSNATFSQIGNYPIQYNLVDFFTFKALTDTTVTVQPDSQKPVLSGLAPTVDLFVGDSFDPRKDAIAIDDVDGDLTSSIVVSGNVDITKAGTYLLTYTVVDKAGNTTIFTRTINVREKPIPMAQVKVVKKDSKSKELLANAEFTVKDAAGNRVDYLITNTNGEAISKQLPLGVYLLEEVVAPVNYNRDTTINTVVLDTEGNVVTTEILNTIKDTEKPVISGIETLVEITEGGAFDPKAGLKANDNIDGDITDTVVVSGTVDTTKAGTYTLTYTATDKAGNTTIFTQMITVKAKPIIDTEKPVISGIETLVEITEGDAFDPKAGLNANDNIDGDITNTVVVSGTVDTTKAGTYTLTYTATDKAGNTTIFTRMITVKAKPIIDTEKPVISGIETLVEITEGDAFDPKAGLKANDNIDGDITNTVVVSGTVDTTKAGTYTLTYTATDKAGNTTVFTRMITVKAKPIIDTEKPVISGIETLVEITEGDAFDPKVGLKASDNIDGDITNTVVVNGTVDTTKAGTYTLTYTATDKAGNTEVFTRIITVKAKPIIDTEKPVISGIETLVEITEGDAFDPKAGLNASDNIDGDITNTVVVSGTVDTTKAGTYTLTYTATDKAGNTTIFTRMITVKAKPVTILQAQIQIIKIDEVTKKPLAGVTFDIKDASGKVVAHFITGADGKAMSSSLPLGEYTIVEVSTVEGYQKDISPHTVKLVKENEILSVVKESKKEPIAPSITKGKIIVSKFDKETKHRLSGMVFKIKHLETGIERIIEMKQYNVMELIDLVEGTYEIVEIKAPDGYEIDTTVYQVRIEKSDDVKLLNIYDIRKPTTSIIAPQVVENKGIVSLPDTGNAKNDNILAVSIGAIMIGISFFVLRRKKR